MRRFAGPDHDHRPNGSGGGSLASPNDDPHEDEVAITAGADADADADALPSLDALDFRGGPASSPFVVDVPNEEEEEEEEGQPQEQGGHDDADNEKEVLLESSLLPGCGCHAPSSSQQPPPTTRRGVQHIVRTCLSKPMPHNHHHRNKMASSPDGASSESRGSTGAGGGGGEPVIALFGRDAHLMELENLCETLRLSSMFGSDEHNYRPPTVVVLKGPSGCGKTALAQEFGRRVMLRASDAAPTEATLAPACAPPAYSPHNSQDGDSVAAAPPQSGDFWDEDPAHRGQHPSSGLASSSTSGRPSSQYRNSPHLGRRTTSSAAGRGPVFVSGKVDQFQRHLPFAAIVRALDELGSVLVAQAHKNRIAKREHQFQDLQRLQQPQQQQAGHDRGLPLQPSLKRSTGGSSRKNKGSSSSSSSTHGTGATEPSDADLKAIRSLLRHEAKTLVPMVPSLTEFVDNRAPNDDVTGAMDDSSSSMASEWSAATPRRCGGGSGRRPSGGAAGEAPGSAEISLMGQSERVCDAKTEGVTERLVLLAVQAFVRAFVQRIRPLVWFVDDLQWADDSSVRLLRTLFADPHLAHALFLLGYRDDESSAALPVLPSSPPPADRAELEDLWRCTHRRIDLTLGNLSVDVEVPWLAHLLNCDDAKARPLAELVHRKTDGNPYFILNFLELLQRRQQLKYKYQAQKWDWSMSDILGADSATSCSRPQGHRPSGTSATLSNYRASSSSHDSSSSSSPGKESLEEMVKMQITSLPLLVQQLLQVASCLGYYFDETLLKGLLQTCDSLLLMGFSHVTALANFDYDEDDVSAGTNPQSEDNEEANEAYLQALYRAEEEGLVRPTRDPRIYQFSHDRVQQIVYQSMASSKEVALLHLKIGKYIQEQEDEQYILDAADQLNRGSLLLVHEMERLELIELNLDVSAHANKRGGINLMSSYLEKAVCLVKDHDWVKSYDLVLEVFNRSAEAEATRGRFDKCMERVEVILKHAKRSDDSIRARFVRIHALGYQGNCQQAVRDSRRLLAELGERLPPSNAVTCLFEFKRTHRLVQDMDLSESELEDLAPVTDDRKIWTAKILKAAALFASDFDPVFSSLVSLRLMYYTLEHGSCDATPFAYASYGAVLAERGWKEEASRFADVALQFVNLSASLVVYSSLNHLKHPFRYGLKPLLSSYRMGLEIGNVHFGGLAVAEYAKLYIACGHPLGPFAEALRNFASQLYLCGLGMPLAFVLPTLQFTLNLRGESNHPCRISLENWKDEFSGCQDLSIDENDASVAYLRFVQLFNAYVVGDWHLMEDLFERTNLAKLPGTHFLNVYFTMVDGLVSVSLLRATGQRKYHGIAAKSIKRMTALDQEQSHNCSGMLSLLQALLESESRKSIDKLSVSKLYDRAIKKFRDSGYLHLGAIANERAAEYMNRCGDTRRENKYRKAAIALYGDWGATVKVALLRGGDSSVAVSSSLPEAARNKKKRFSSFRSSVERSRGFLSERFDS